MRFIDEHFPLIVTVSAPELDANEIQSMSEGFEKYFARGQRYAVLNLTPAGFKVPEHAMRARMSEWVNHPRIRDFTKRLCVGAATVQPSTLYRIAFNVVMAIQKPATPMSCVATLEEGFDYCFERMRAENLATVKPFDMVRYELLPVLKALL